MSIYQSEGESLGQVRVQVDVPTKALFQLTDAAELVGLTVGEFLLDAALRTARVRGAVPDAVQRLHGQGFADAEIGRALNMTNRAVATQRRRLQLPPNRLIRGSNHERKAA